jgi:hypothetical protein
LSACKIPNLIDWNKETNLRARFQKDAEIERSPKKNESKFGEELVIPPTVPNPHILDFGGGTVWLILLPHFNPLQREIAERRNAC